MSNHLTPVKGIINEYDVYAGLRFSFIYILFHLFKIYQETINIPQAQENHSLQNCTASDVRSLPSSLNIEKTTDV